MVQTQIRRFCLSVLFLFYFTSAQAKIEASLGLDLTKNPNLMGSIPWTPDSEIILSRSQYVISYNKIKRSPNWVAWRLQSSDMGNTGRTKTFSQDAELENYLVTSGSGLHAVLPEDYKGSCYDRGHQIPSADRTDTQENNEKTFLMSNVLPQTAYLNRVVWEHLEHYTRELVQQDKKVVYVIAGPIYDENFGSIGQNHDIPVPSKNFKVIVILDQGQSLKDIGPKTPTISVIMPNLNQDGTKPHEGDLKNCSMEKSIGFDVENFNDWKEYQTTLSEVENESGLRLFTEIPVH